MAYQEDGETLEDLASFTGNGFEPMPALYHDQERIHNVVNWTGSMLTQRIIEYTEFINRDPVPMPRALKTARRLLQHMVFEEGQRVEE